MQEQTTLPPIKYTKRVGHLFEHVRDLDNIKAAIHDAAKGKRKRKGVQNVLDDIDNKALEIQKMLDDESWIPSPYTFRTINDGIQKKQRRIAIPRFFPDQCIHHAFVRVFRQVVLHSATPFTYGCIPGRGTTGSKKHGKRGAKNDIEKWIRKDPKHTKYCAKLDMKQHYPNISHAQLRRKFEKRIKDKKFNRLAFKIIASYQQPMVTGGRLLPEEEAKGVPVGLYTSPWLSNFFFQDLDHAILEKFHVAHVARYVDDIVLFDSSKRRLHKAVRAIEAEAAQEGQVLKRNWQVFPLSSRPLDFLGYKFYPEKTTIRKSILFRMTRKARRISKTGYISAKNAHAMVSYFGYIKNSDSCQLYKDRIAPFVNMKRLKGVIANEDRKQRKAGCLPSGSPSAA